MAFRRLLAVLFLVAAVFVASPVRADDGLMPPATDGTRQALSDQYPPGSLQFYTDSASWLHPAKQMKNGVTVIVSAFFDFEAEVVKWVVRAVDYAWNFNLARWFGSVIDSVNARMSLVVWSFGGGLCTLIGAWLTFQVWQGAMSRMMGGLALLGIVLALVMVTQSGMSTLVGDVEDIGSDLSAQLLTAGAVGEQTDSGTTSMTDGVYRQLILEQWARANFSSLDAAQKYAAFGVPGGRYLGLGDEQAQAQFDRDKGTHNPDLAPWYEDGALGRRIGIVLETALSMVLFLPILFLLAALVLGTKGLGLFFIMGYPVALFIAAMPWFGGLRFLRGYTIWACIAPIIKVFCSVGLALYMAFLDGLMGASQVVPGGWGTITLLMGAMAVTLYFMGRPIVRLFTGLIGRTRSKNERPAPKPQSARPAVALAGSAGGRRWKTRTGRNLTVLRPGQRLPVRTAKPRAVPKGSLKVPAKGQQSRGRHIHEVAKYAALRDVARRTGGRGGLPQYDLVDLMREAKRVMRAVANTVEGRGGGGR